MSTSRYEVKPLFFFFLFFFLAFISVCIVTCGFVKCENSVRFT